MKKNSILIVVCLFVCMLFNNAACGQTKAEKRQAAIDSLKATIKRENELAALRRRRLAQAKNKVVFGDNDEIFSNNSIPARWNNESAVILARKNTFRYYKEDASSYLEQTERNKIKLLDKAAVDSFSVFYFIPNNQVGFKIIKKDGTVRNISTDNAVPVDQYLPIPESFSMMGTVGYIYSKDYKKLAIQGLEPGDIIDYYYKYTTSVYTEGMDVAPFPPVMFTLSGNYPIVKQKIVLNVQKGFYVNFVSCNNAPGLTKVEDTSDSFNTYQLTESMRDKRNDEMWEDIYRAEPTVKFQVVYVSEDQKSNVPYFLGKMSVPMSKVSPSMLKAVVNRIALETTPDVKDYASAIIKYMRREHDGVKDPGLYMEYAYNYFRYYLTTGNSSDNSQSGFSDNIDDNLQDESTITSETFAKTMGLVCRDKKIGYAILFMVPRYLGTIDNLIMPGELRWAIRVNGTPDLYLYPFDAFTDPGEPVEGMEGIDAFVLTPDKDTGKVEIEKTVMPVSTDADNRSLYMDTVELNPVAGSVSLKRTAYISGLIKERYFPDIISETSFLEMECKRYGETLEEVYKKLNGNKSDVTNAKLNNDIATENEARKERMKDFFSGDFNISSYDEFHLLCDGREIDSSRLIFNDKFTVKNLIQKVGANYIFDAGQLIGAQLTSDDTMPRVSDVYLPCTAQYNNEIRIIIPNGYSVVGVEALNSNVTDKVGGFVSTADLEGNILVIKTKKYFSRNYEPASEWKDITMLLKAAYNFTQKKVLLKKV